MKVVAETESVAVARTEEHGIELWVLYWRQSGKQQTFMSKEGALAALRRIETC